MKYLITYDICDGRRWSKVFRYLKSKGLNVQLSCFEIETSNINEIMDKMLELVDVNCDSVYLFPIGEDSSFVVKLGRRESVDESKVL